MNICLISEGSYPYVSGGVSTWVNDIINSMPEKRFSILSIMPDCDSASHFKYEIPPNVTVVKTLYLDDYLKLDPAKIRKEPLLGVRDRRELQKFFDFDKHLDWAVLSGIFGNPKKSGDVVQLLQSKVFWEVLLHRYKESFEEEEFNRFFWTFRSMLLPVVHLMQQDFGQSDVYHAVSTGYAGLMGIMLKKKHKRPLLLTEHGIYAREREEEILSATWVEGVYKRLWIDFFYFISMGVYESADKIVSLFERNKKIQVEIGADCDKTVVIPNGVDCEKFDMERQPHDGFIIGAVLRVVPIKDVKTLIRAFKVVSEELEDAALYIVGPTEEDVEYYEECVRLVSNLQLDRRVVFTGKMDVKEIMPRLDVMVLTSISEGQPLVILEAMAAGIPFVSTDVGSCRELLEGPNDDFGPAGIVTRLVDPGETAQALIEVLKNETLSTSMSDSGRKRARCLYGKQALIERYRNLYERLR